MGVWHPVDMRPRGPFPEEKLSPESLRARGFSACAELFRSDAVLHPRAIRSILAVFDRISECHRGHGPMHQAGADALAWFAANPGSDVLAEEYVRLYGGANWADQMPLIPPCACSYLSEPVDGTVGDVLATYESTGFKARTEGGRCPAHISNELDFVAHCMGAAAAGHESGSAAARLFVVTHLFHWGVVFAAATYARAELPPYRFAGAVLEQLLFCALDHATATDAPGSALRFEFPA